MEEVVCRWLLIGPQGPEGWVIVDTGEVVYVSETQKGKVVKVKKAGDEFMLCLFSLVTVSLFM